MSVCMASMACARNCLSVLREASSSTKRALRAESLEFETGIGGLLVTLRESVASLSGETLCSLLLHDGMLPFLVSLHATRKTHATIAVATVPADRRTFLDAFGNPNMKQEVRNMIQENTSPMNEYVVLVFSRGSEASIQPSCCAGSAACRRCPRVSKAALMPVFTTRNMDLRNSTQRQRAACS